MLKLSFSACYLGPLRDDVSTLGGALVLYLIAQRKINMAYLR